jgi:hypothetical protein
VMQAGFEQNRSFLDFNLLMIYKDLDHEMLSLRSPWQVVLSPEPGVEGRPS